MTDTRPTHIGILGAGGRMGQAIAAALGGHPEATIAGAVERDGHAAVGSEIAVGVTVGTDLAALAGACDVLVDFTAPGALAAHLVAARDAGCAILVGTTGLGAEHQAALDEAARDVAVLQAANTSLGVALLAALVEQAAARLGPEWDIEIAEHHHRHKVDAPSGTALLLGSAAARGRGVDLDAVSAVDRNRARRPGDIGFASLRGGSAAGDHLVLLAGDGERVELAHRAESRDIFARGAVRAALWLAGRAPGRYAMHDVLGL